MTHEDQFPAEHHAYVAFRAENGERVYSTAIGDRHNGSEKKMREYVAKLADNGRSTKIDDVVLIARYELVEIKEVRIR